MQKKLSKKDQNTFLELINVMEAKQRDSLLLVLGRHPECVPIFWKCFVEKKEAFLSRNKIAWNSIIKSEREVLQLVEKSGKIK